MHNMILLPMPRDIPPTTPSVALPNLTPQKSRAAFLGGYSHAAAAADADDTMAPCNAPSSSRQNCTIIPRLNLDIDPNGGKLVYALLPPLPPPPSSAA